MDGSTYVGNEKRPLERALSFQLVEAEALASFSQLTDIQNPTCALCNACNALWTARQRTLGEPRIRRIR